MDFLLAWRNIWRNPRRTTVILIAIIIGVWSMLFTGALTRGMINQMVDNGISTLTGEIQIHRRGYRSDPVVENSITTPEEISDMLETILPPGAKWAARVRVNAIASNARHSTGVTLVGIIPSREAEISFIGKALTQGRYLKLEDKYGIVVGKALLDKFETKLGRKLVLMSQAMDKEISSRAFRIIGIFDAEMESTEKQFVFVSMSAAQQMLKLGKSISEISVILPDREDVDRIADEMRSALPTDYEVDTWKTLLPIIKAYLEMMDGWMFIWYLIVFIAMGFGIVNTMLMAIFERIREFGLLKALGMKPWRILKTVIVESFLLLLVGSALGNLIGFLSIFALSKEGIDLSSLAEGAEYAGMSRVIYPAIHSQDIIVANLVVFVLGLFVCLYPAVKAAKVTPVEALAHT